jgi:Xaa-Pro aminopeptidase
MNTQRLKKLQSIITRPHLVKKRENLFYLTGADFIHGYLLIFPGLKKPVFFGDGLEKIEGVSADYISNINKYLKPGIELEVENILSLAESEYLKKKGLKVKPVHSLLDIIRAIKDKEEIVEIGRSMQLVEKVFNETKKQLVKKTWTEIELARFIKLRGLQLGASDVSFDPIVAAGSNAAIPHHKPGKKILKSGESIVIDMGYKVNGYCSDFTRTVFLKKVSGRLLGMYKATALAARSAFAAAGPGMKAYELDKVARDILAKHKMDKYFFHSLGHGTGLEIHEWPRVSEGSTDTLQNGMVFSIEPGVYIKNVGGIRIEDLVYLEKGVCKNFTNVSMTLAANVIK